MGCILSLLFTFHISIYISDEWALYNKSWQRFIFLDLLHLFSLQSSRRVGPMPQRFMLSLHIHRHLFPVEVTPQLLLQVIDIYASISCWEPSTDMKSLLHFPQACRGGRLRDLDVILLMTSYRKSRFVRMRKRVCACAFLSPRMRSPSHAN